MEYFRPIQVEMGLCIHCERCAMTCKNKAIHFDGHQRFIDYERCRGCLSCKNVCPRNAITITNVEENEIIAVDVLFNNCSACGKCAELCPEDLWVLYNYTEKDGNIKEVYRVSPEKVYLCKGCRKCEDNCPEKAISIQKFSSKK